MNEKAAWCFEWKPIKTKHQWLDFMQSSTVRGFDKSKNHRMLRRVNADFFRYLEPKYRTGVNEVTTTQSATRSHAAF